MGREVGEVAWRNGESLDYGRQPSLAFHLGRESRGPRATRCPHKEQGGALSREAPCQNGKAPTPSPRLHWGHEGEWGRELETHETQDPAAEKPPEGTDSWHHRSATLTSAPLRPPGGPATGLYHSPLDQQHSWIRP